MRSIQRLLGKLVWLSTEKGRSLMITAKLWRLGVAPELLPLHQAATTAEGVLVITVDANSGNAEEVHGQLQAIFDGQLTLEMVTDLLAPDDLPEVKLFDLDGRMRKVSSFGVRTLVQGRDGDSGLVFEPIEFLAGEGWLICHWQPCKAYRIGQGVPSEFTLPSREHIEDEVARQWRDQGGQTAGDLGVLFLYELSLNYTKARRALWTRLNAWEREFYSLRPGSDTTELVETLRELHRLHGELNRRLDGLNVPWKHADTSWFADVKLVDTAKSVDGIIDRSLNNLHSFSDSLRQAVSLTASYATLRHFELAEEQKMATEHLTRRFELGAAILLVPTLIAGVYGANTLLPGGGHWSGFIAMVTLMVMGSAGAYFALEWGRARKSE